MNEQALEARRAYKREWNRRNREKVKAAQNRYWERKAEEAAAAAAAQMERERITAETALQEAAAEMATEPAADLDSVKLSPDDLARLGF